MNHKSRDWQRWRVIERGADFFWLVTLLLWSAMCQRYPKVPNASNKKIDCCAVKVSSLWDVDRRVAVGLFHVCRVLFRSIQRFLEDQRKARTLYQFMLSFALQHVFFHWDHPKITLLRVIPTMTFQNSLLTPLLSEAFVTGLLPN